jgi:hypothetical protein
MDHWQTIVEIVDWKAIAGTISALVAVTGLFIGWRNSREEGLRRGDVLAWANEVIYELQTLLLLCILKEPELDVVVAKEKLQDAIFNTSILIERGRLFFKNEVIDDHGKEKETAYRGYRPKILDPIVTAHQIACGWTRANEDTRLRMRLLAEDCLKKFVSIVQTEVGRSRTASADTAKGGEGVRLGQLLQGVDQGRLERLKQIRPAA